MTHEIVIVAMNDSVGLSIFSPIDLLHTANKIAALEKENNINNAPLFHTRIVSLDGNSVTVSGGHSINVDGALSDVINPAVIILPGLSTDKPQDLVNTMLGQDELIRQVLAGMGKETILAAACTGSILAAKTGLLNGKKATTTWWLESAFKTHFPEVEVDKDEILIDTGKVITSAAGASSLDLSLYLVKRFAGPHIARLCAHLMVIDNARHSQRPCTIPWHEKTRDPFLEKADEWIRKQSLDCIKVENLADSLGVSPRTLLRRFQKLTGDTPQIYIQNIRMEWAKTQLEKSDSTIAVLATELGFSDENAFRRAFGSCVGLSPSQYRRQYHLIDD